MNVSTTFLEWNNFKYTHIDMNSKSIPSISFDWKSIALKWEINK